MNDFDISKTVVVMLSIVFCSLVFLLKFSILLTKLQTTIDFNECKLQQI